jgi:hypothetical protein
VSAARKDRRVQVHISPELLERLKAVAEERIVSVSLLVERGLNDWLDRLPPLPGAGPLRRVETLRRPDVRPVYSHNVCGPLNRHGDVCRCDGRGVIPALLPSQGVVPCDCPTCSPSTMDREKTG